MALVLGSAGDAVEALVASDAMGWLTRQNLSEAAHVVVESAKETAFALVFLGVGPIYPIMIVMLFTDWDPVTWTREHAGWVLVYSVGATIALWFRMWISRDYERQLDARRRARG